MDQTWETVAQGYQFICNGCKDNCCNSLFFHHTHIEKAYLAHGFDGLDQNRKKAVTTRARIYIEKVIPDGSNPTALRILCPLIEDNQCLLYSFRPMICRLHGLPHEICTPGKGKIKGLGCKLGSFDDKPYLKFDRTLFYQQMAQAEMKFRQDFHKTGKIKETIAQMLVSPEHNTSCV